MNDVIKSSRFIVIAAMGIGMMASIFSISRFIQVTKDYNNLSVNLDKLTNIGSRPKQLESESLIDYANVSHKNVINFVNDFCQSNKAQIVRIEPIKLSPIENMELATLEMVLEGDFVTLMKGLAEIHDDIFPIRLTSIRFEKSKLTTKKPTLTLRLLFQYVISKK